MTTPDEDPFGTHGLVVPDIPEPITAHRRWTVDGDTLTGWGSTTWPAGEPLVAEHKDWVCPDWFQAHIRSSGERTCTTTPSPAAKGADDHSGYGCGIYGYATPADMARHAGLIRHRDTPGTALYIEQGRGVWGTVELGGTVYIHDHGYRASHGLVTGIYDTGGAHDARIAAAYGVPLLPLPDDARAHLNARRAEVAEREAQREARPAELEAAVQRLADDPIKAIGAAPTRRVRWAIALHDALHARGFHTLATAVLWTTDRITDLVEAIAARRRTKES